METQKDHNGSEVEAQFEAETEMLEFQRSGMVAAKATGASLKHRVSRSTPTKVWTWGLGTRCGVMLEEFVDAACGGSLQTQ